MGNSVSQNLKSRDASASKKQKRKTLLWTKKQSENTQKQCNG